MHIFIDWIKERMIVFTPNIRQFRIFGRAWVGQKSNFLTIIWNTFLSANLWDLMKFFQTQISQSFSSTFLWDGPWHRLQMQRSRTSRVESESVKICLWLGTSGGDRRGQKPELPRITWNTFLYKNLCDLLKIYLIPTLTVILVSFSFTWTKCSSCKNTALDKESESMKNGGGGEWFSCSYTD